MSVAYFHGAINSSDIMYEGDHVASEHQQQRDDANDTNGVETYKNIYEKKKELLKYRIKRMKMTHKLGEATFLRSNFDAKKKAKERHC